jgi:heptosyltransferase III
MKTPNRRDRRPLRYRIDHLIRGVVMRVIGGLAKQSTTRAIGSSDSIKKILLVRANHRIGNAILTLPAVSAFRQKFPQAQIDFVGSSISSVLFQYQPLDNHYVAPRRFPRVVWQYLGLIRRLRGNGYDLAVDVSCSQSGVGSFVVGLSGARVRVGLAGKFDYLFNLKIDKLSSANKYRKLRDFLTAMGVEPIDEVGSLKFSSIETIEGLNKLESVVEKKTGKTVGIFVGGRKLRGKRWPLENFVQLTDGLNQRGARVSVFLGPEEKDIADSLRASLPPSIPVILEPSIRKFAAMVSHLDLLICSDSGPMHLACAVGVRVVAMFLGRDVARWAPPSSVARALSGNECATAAQVLEIACEELAHCSRPTEGLRTVGAAASHR